MRHDRVHNEAVSGGPGEGGEHLLPQSVRDGVGDPACVYDDPLVREGGQQTATVGDADGRVESDRLPDLVDVGFGNAVLPEDGGSQIGALDLEASLT
jgi:hypothetical protein